MDIEVLTCPANTEITGEIVGQYIAQHQQYIPQYQQLYKMYIGDHPILYQRAKEQYKPDNRLVVNYAKYIVDTLNGYFVGNPIRVTHPIREIADRVDDLLKRNDQDDNNSELSKLCSIYGHAYELLYQDEESRTCLTYCDPLSTFVVYDDTVAQQPLFGVYYQQTDAGYTGTLYTALTTHEITSPNGDIILSEGRDNPYHQVPIIEYLENEERLSAFAPVISLINAYNRAMSEKANDVDYFADAYLKVLGAEIDAETLQVIRDSRIINLHGNAVDVNRVDVGFIDKPNADGTQEHLIDRLERLIYQISMVSNINSEDFGNASGVALAFKLQSMENLALNKERKFVSAMNQRFKMIFGVSLDIKHIDRDQWRDLEYIFTRNIPHNIRDEAETVATLEGIIAKEDQLKLLSSIPNVKDAIQRLQAEATVSAQDPYADQLGGEVIDGPASDVLAQPSTPAMASDQTSRAYSL